MEEKKINWDEVHAELDDIIAFDDEGNSDWIQEVLNLQHTKKELYEDYVKGLLEWYSLLNIAVSEDEFEVCVKIQKVLEIEKENLKGIIDKYYAGLTPQDEKTIEKISKKANELFIK